MRTSKEKIPEIRYFRLDANAVVLPVMKYLFSVLLISSSCMAQNLIVPGQPVFDKKFIRNGTYEMACYSEVNGRQVEVSTFVLQIQSSATTLAVYTTLYANGSKKISVDTSIADGRTFQPIYRSSFGQSKDMVIRYGKGVTGYYYDKKTQKRHSINENISPSFFDSYTYPYILGLLPLASGYKSDLAVYEFKPGNQTNAKRARIEEVKSNLYKSGLTGEHKVWQVKVYEEATKDSYVYYVDKDTRRLWKIEINTQGQQLLLVDKETDFNPFTVTFDKAQTLKLVTAGNSVILGQVFARDNENEGPLKNMAVLNINKKQYPRSGTTVLLFPYTDFYKEWIELSGKAKKKGLSVALPKDASDCIKMTTVYDDQGHFEFTNLMPGDYLLFTEFGYVHTTRRTEVTGYTDTYINGNYQGSRENTTTYRYGVNAAAAVKKVVTIKTDGSKNEVKLKKTR